jgi:DNA-binding LytR/AlgR family response regulator
MKKCILIVEDEMLIASVLKKYIEQANYVCAGIATDYEEAIYSMQQCKIDFLFLDISLKGEKNGLDLANYINKKHKYPFIFLTSHSDNKTLIEVAKTNPVGYLSKPFKDVDVTTALKLYFKDDNKLKFKLRIEKSFYYVDLNKLIYAEAQHVYVQMEGEEESFMLRIALSKLIKLLPDHSLIRINRSVAVNPKKIQKINKNSLNIHTKNFKLSPKYFEGYKHLLQ